MDLGLGGATVVAGVIFDTHGLIRPATLAALAGTNVILHAGDVYGEVIDLGA